MERIEVVVIEVVRWKILEADYVLKEESSESELSREQHIIYVSQVNLKYLT